MPAFAVYITEPNRLPAPALLPSPSVMSKTAAMDSAGIIIAMAIVGILIWGMVDLGVLRGHSGSNAFGPISFV